MGICEGGERVSGAGGEKTEEEKAEQLRLEQEERDESNGERS